MSGKDHIQITNKDDRDLIVALVSKTNTLIDMREEDRTEDRAVIKEVRDRLVILNGSVASNLTRSRNNRALIGIIVGAIIAAAITNLCGLW